MRTFLQTLFFFLLVTQICFAQWDQQNSGTTKNLYAVQFTDANNGLAVGDSGTVIRTNDGGTSWTPVVTGITDNFTGMCFIDANKVWAITGIKSEFYNEFPDSGIILHSTDCGITWTDQITMPLTLLNDITFVDADNGWAVGASRDRFPEYSIILRTTNGGTTWTQQSIDTIPLITNVEFDNSSTGWIISTSIGLGSSSSIYKTADAGNTWSPQFVTAGFRDSFINDIVFHDLNNGIAVGNLEIHIAADSALILKTTDGGANWTQILIDYPGLNSVFFTSATEVTTVGEEGIILHTSDGGTSWEPQTSGTTNLLTNVCFIDALNGWAVGENGIILHTTNGGVNFVEEEQLSEVPTEFLLSNNYPNPFNPNTKIKYSVPQASQVQIKVFDVLGNEIETLANEEKPAGTFEINWYAEQLPSGVYFYQLRAGSFVETKKMLLLK